MGTLDLPEIRTTSPALAETMPACLLRLGYPRQAAAPTSSSELRSLETAHEEVLENSFEIGRQKSLDGAAEQLWDIAIAAQQHRADAHVPDRRLGSPMTWRGFHFARASVTPRARAAGAECPCAETTRFAAVRGGKLTLLAPVEPQGRDGSRH